MVRSINVAVDDLTRTRSPLAAAPLCVRCITQADYDEWTAWTGRKPDFVHAFGGSTSATFNDCLGVVRSHCAEWPGVALVWALPLATSGCSLTNVAAGAYDEDLRAILAAILAHNPVGPIYLRIGWEATNPGVWPWSATNEGGPGDYIAAFRHYADLAHATSTRFKVDWNVSAYGFDYAGAEFDARTLYPGDDYVDVIGIDAYLIGVRVASGVTFGRMCGRSVVADDGYQYGIKTLAAFARAHGKQLSFPEWGIGADRPDYIRDLAQFIADPANNVAYHGYWNKGSGDTDFPCRLSDSSNSYPLAKAAFLDCFTDTGKDYVEQSETPAYFAKSHTPPAEARRNHVDDLLKVLKYYGLIGGIDDKPALDGLYLLAAAEGEIARVSPILPGGFTTTVPRTTGRLALNGSPDFVADRGYKGDGAAAYLGTSINPVTASPAGGFLQDSAHMGLWSLTADNPAAQQYECGNGYALIGRNTAGAWVGRPNQTATVSITNSGAGAGHIIWNRTGASAWASYLNGSAQKTGTDASAALLSSAFSICAVPSQLFGSQRLAIFHWGRALVQSGQRTEITQLYQALLAYLTSIGAVST